jgi:hypothetical protein
MFIKFLINSILPPSSIGAFLIFDLAYEKSFNNLESWYNDLIASNSNPYMQILLIGNKSDLK